MSSLFPQNLFIQETVGIIKTEGHWCTLLGEGGPWPTPKIVHRDSENHATRKNDGKNMSFQQKGPDPTVYVLFLLRNGWWMCHATKGPQRSHSTNQLSNICCGTWSWLQSLKSVLLLWSGCLTIHGTGEIWWNMCVYIYIYMHMYFLSAYTTYWWNLEDEFDRYPDIALGMLQKNVVHNMPTYQPPTSDYN